MLPVARKRLVTIGDESPLIDAAKLLREPHADILVVCSCDELLAGVITKTDLVRAISHGQESGCSAARKCSATRSIGSLYIRSLSQRLTYTAAAVRGTKCRLGVPGGTI